MDLKCFGIQMVSPWAMSNVPDQYIRKQDDVHLSGIKMVGLSGIQMAIKNRTIWHPTSFQPFEYQTILVYDTWLHLKSGFFSVRILNEHVTRLTF